MQCCGRKALELDIVRRVQSKDTPEQLNMDLAASTAATSGAQSIEWLFKKERMYLLAQFWQQVRASAVQGIAWIVVHPSVKFHYITSWMVIWACSVNYGVQKDQWIYWHVHKRGLRKCA